MSVGKSASKGFVSFFIRNMLDKVLGMVAMIILARKLTPYDFGLVSITEVLLSIITAFGAAGIGEYLYAYRKKDVRRAFKAVFWFNLLITIGIVIVFLIVAPLWAKYQEDTRIVTISFISAGIFFFSQMQVIPKTLLAKNLKYQTQVKIQTPFIILTQVGKIAAVFLDMGVYSLIVPILILQPILTFFLYRGAKFSPGFRMYRERWKEIFSYTKHLIGASLLARIADQGDKIILSKFLGLEVLGVYNIALQLAELFTAPFIMISNNVLASVLPRYAEDKEKFYSNYMSFLKSFIFAVFPLLGIMVVAANPIILTLYGTKWIAAEIPLQILLVYTSVRVATSSFGVLMNTLHLTKKVFGMNLVYTPIHIVSALVGSLFGMIGVATSMVTVKTCFTVVPVSIISKALKLPHITWYKDVAPFFITTVSLVLLLLALKNVFGINPDIPSLLFVAIIGIVYMLCYYLIARFFLVKQLKIVSGFLGQTAPKMRGYFNIAFGLK